MLKIALHLDLWTLMAYFDGAMSKWHSLTSVQTIFIVNRIWMARMFPWIKRLYVGGIWWGWISRNISWSFTKKFTWVNTTQKQDGRYQFWSIMNRFRNIRRKVSFRYKHSTYRAQNWAWWKFIKEHLRSCKVIWGQIISEHTESTYLKTSLEPILYKKFFLLDLDVIYSVHR